MRILMIQDWNAGHGGAEAYTLWLRDALRDSGDEVRLLTSDAGSAANGEAEYVAHAPRAMAARAFTQIANPMAKRTVERAVREFRPDVAWANMFALHLSPAALDGLGGVPWVLAVSDYKYTCPGGTRLLPDGAGCTDRPGRICLRQGCMSLPHWLRDRIRYARIHAAVARARRIVSCSRAMHDDLRASGIASEVLHWPVPAPSASYARQPSAEPSALFFGRIDREKGVDVLLRAWGRVAHEIPRAHLRLAGTGPLDVELQALARALGVQEAVQFLGWLTPGEIEEELSRAWVSVAPSRFAEPFGLVAAEAIVRGVPAIVSRTGGLAEIVEEGRHGLLFPNGDESALAECLRSALGGSIFPRRTLSGEVVAEARERFSMATHVAIMRDILRSAITS